MESASWTSVRDGDERQLARLDAKLEQRVGDLRAEMNRRFEEIHHAARAEASLKAVRETIADCRNSLVRWMIGLWLVQMLVYAGLWLSGS